MPPPDKERKQEANQLIDEYLAGESQPAVGEDIKVRIAKLVEELGSDDWATRENASKQLIAIGKPALAALKEASRSKDAEIASRARDAAEKIEGAGSIIEQLRALGGVGAVTVQERLIAERRAVVGKAGAAAEAELAGRKDEAEQLRAEARKAQVNVALLVKLSALLAQSGGQPAPGVEIRYGVKMMIERD